MADTVEQVATLVLQCQLVCSSSMCVCVCDGECERERGMVPAGGCSYRTKRRGEAVIEGEKKATMSLSFK